MPPKAKLQGQSAATSAKKVKASGASRQTHSPATATTSATVSVLPSDISRWPALTPKLTLSLVTVLDSQIYLIPAFLTSKECTALITHIERHISLTQISRKGEAFRSNDRSSFINPVLALTLWNLGLGSACGTGALTIGDAAPMPCGLNTNIRVYRYTSGQRFDPHYDISNRDPITGMWSEWTLLVYLTGTEEDGLEGGETVFYTSTGKDKDRNAVVVKPERGMVLMHRHGKNCLLHEAKEVTRGVKWVLRSDVMVHS